MITLSTLSLKFYLFSFGLLLRVTQSVAELAEVANSYVRSAKASFSKTLVADWDKTEF